MLFKGLVKITRRIIAASALLAFVVLYGTASAATTTFSYSGPPVAIPDSSGADIPGTQVGAPISVSGLAGLVTGITMSIDGTACSATAGSTTVGIDHTFVNDLQITLRSPSGTDVLVISRTDGGGNNFCQVVLDDSAATSIQTVVSSQAPFTGTWLPNAPLSAFIGEDPNGTWTLLAQDFFVADTGNIRAWSVTITDNSAPTASSVGMSGSAVVGSTLTGSYTYADVDGDPEGTSTFRWMSDSVNTGATKTPIGGATALTYVVQPADQGRYLFFCVTPVAATGTSPGTEVCSSASAAIPAISLTAVPTLSEWGTLIIFLMLGMTAIFWLRRKTAR